MSSTDRLEINGTPSQFDLMTAYFMRTTNNGPTIGLSTGDTPQTKSLWTATVHSCIPLNGDRNCWRIMGYISRGIGSMGSDSRPYEAAIHTDKPKGWLRVLDGELPDYVVKFERFSELPEGQPFLFIGLPCDGIGRGDPQVMRRKGKDAQTIEYFKWMTNVHPDAKVVRVRT